MNALNNKHLEELAVYGYIREHELAYNQSIKSLCVQMTGSLTVFNFNYSKLATVFTNASMVFTPYQLFLILNPYPKELIFLELNQVQTDTTTDISCYFISRVLKRKLSYTTTEIRDFYDILSHYFVWFMSSTKIHKLQQNHHSLFTLMHNSEFNIENIYNALAAHSSLSINKPTLQQIYNLIAHDSTLITKTTFCVLIHMVQTVIRNCSGVLIIPQHKLPFCLTNSFVQKLIDPHESYMRYQNKEFHDGIEAIVRLMNGIKLDIDTISWDVQQTMLDLIKHKLQNIDYKLPNLAQDIEMVLDVRLLHVPDAVEVFAIELIKEYKWLNDVFVREETVDDEPCKTLNVGNLCNLYSHCNHIIVVLWDWCVVPKAACLSLCEDIRDRLVNKNVVIELKWPSYRKMYSNQLQFNECKDIFEKIHRTIRVNKTSISIAPIREQKQIVLKHSIVTDLDDDDAAELASYHDLFVCGYIHENIMMPHNLWIPDAIKSLCVRFVGRDQIDAIYIRRHVNIYTMDTAQFITVLRVTIDNLGCDIDADKAAQIAWKCHMNGLTVVGNDLGEGCDKFCEEFKSMDGWNERQWSVIYKDIGDTYGEGKSWKKMDISRISAKDARWASDEELQKVALQYVLDAPIPSSKRKPKRKRTKTKSASKQTTAMNSSFQNWTSFI
eukprot:584826_1